MCYYRIARYDRQGSFFHRAAMPPESLDFRVDGLILAAIVLLVAVVLFGKRTR
jgi:hypothetical protein